VDPDQIKHATFKDVSFTDEAGVVTNTTAMTVPIKFKFCCGDPDNMRKVAKIKNFLRQHFTDILNKPRKSSRLQAVAKKIKSLFKFGSKQKDESTRKF
jgi:hypothetical protein